MSEHDGQCGTVDEYNRQIKAQRQANSREQRELEATIEKVVTTSPMFQAQLARHIHKIIKETLHMKCQHPDQICHPIRPNEVPLCRKDIYENDCECKCTTCQYE